MNWTEHCNQLSDLMSRLDVSGSDGAAIPVNEAFVSLRRLAESLRVSQNTIYCIGNGASASIASHFAADMAKNGSLHTEVFSDLALITAISNDMGYEEVFAEPLRRRAKRNDMLVAISSSGNSENILRCVKCAKDMGLKVITFSAMNPGNPLRASGDINFYFPAKTYGDAESLHAMTLHYWIDLFLGG